MDDLDKRAQEILKIALEIQNLVDPIIEKIPESHGRELITASARALCFALYQATRTHKMEILLTGKADAIS